MNGILIMFPEGIDAQEFYDRNIKLETRHFAYGIYLLNVPDAEALNFVHEIFHLTNGNFEIKKNRGYPIKSKKK